MSEPAVDVGVLGNLARLDFSEADRQHFAQQLPGILDYVGQLQAVEVERIAPVISTVIALRSDQAEISRAVDRILAEAPEREQGWWKVSSVF